MQSLLQSQQLVLEWFLMFQETHLFFVQLVEQFGYTSRELLISSGMALELSTFLASTIVGIIALYWSRKYIVPRPVYTIASIIPLLPGTYAFAAIINLISMNAHGVTPDLISMFIDNSLKTIIILGGIGIWSSLTITLFCKIQ